jgi:hypothetical protein
MSASPIRTTQIGVESRLASALSSDASLSADASLLSSLISAAQAAYADGGWSSLSATGVTASMVDLKILRGVADAFDAALRIRAAELQPPPPPPPPGPTPGPGPTPPPPPEGSGSGSGSGQPDVSQTSLDEKSGVGAAAGRRRDRHAKVLHHFPTFADALVVGEITESHLSALSEVLFSATEEVWEALRAEEDNLLIAAGRLGPVSYRKFVTQTVIRVAAALDVPVDRDLSAEIILNLWRDKDSGVGHLFATYDPKSFAEISAILRKAAGKLQFHDRTLTEKQALGRALINLLTQKSAHPGARTGAHAGAQTGGRGGSGVVSEVRPVVSILIDEKTLLEGPHADTICEYDDGSRLPVDTAREIACTASLTPILRDKWGVVLDLGREFRYATPTQRRAMEAMYSTCFHDACETPITQCHEHHMIYWEHGGRTDMANLLPVCQTHHRWIHANNPHISMDEHRTVTVTMANGTQTTHRPNRQPYRRAERQCDRRSDAQIDHGSATAHTCADSDLNAKPKGPPGYLQRLLPHPEVA